MLSVRVDLKDLSRVIKAINREVDYSKRLAMDIVYNGILKRTAMGKDADNVSFKPYSKGYGLKRKKLGLSTDIKNLRVTGGLLNSPTAYARSTPAILSVGDAYSAIASGLMHNTRTGIEHQFFLAADSDSKEIEDAVTFRINAIR